MNSYDERAALNLGLTGAGTLIGGPIGGMIGSFAAKGIGSLIKDKQTRVQNTSAVMANPMNAFTPGDYGKGFIKSDSYVTEKPTTASGLMDAAASLVPMATGMIDPTFKGLAFAGNAVKSVAGMTASMPELGKQMGTGLTSTVPTSVVDKVLNTADKISNVKTAFDKSYDIYMGEQNQQDNAPVDASTSSLTNDNPNKVVSTQQGEKFIRDVETRPKTDSIYNGVNTHWSTSLFGGLDLTDHENIDNVDAVSGVSKNMLQREMLDYNKVYTKPFDATPQFNLEDKWMNPTQSDMAPYIEDIHNRKENYDFQIESKDLNTINKVDREGNIIGSANSTRGFTPGDNKNSLTINTVKLPFPKYGPTTTPAGEYPFTDIQKAEPWYQNRPFYAFKGGDTDKNTTLGLHAYYKDKYNPDRLGDINDPSGIKCNSFGCVNTTPKYIDKYAPKIGDHMIITPEPKTDYKQAYSNYMNSKQKLYTYTGQ